MEPWEDELLWDDDFSDEEEVAEEQIEETGLKMDEDSWSRTSIPETMPPSWRTRRKKRRPPVRSGSSVKFAQRLCGGWRKQPGQNPTF